MSASTPSAAAAPPTSHTLRAAVDRGADWLVSQMNTDGSLRGGTSINEYYKTAFGLACAGRPIEADRMLGYTARRFLRADGSLDGEGCAWFPAFELYPHAWVAMTALMRARFDIAERIAGHLAAFQDPATGGFYSTSEQRRRQGEQEMMTTGVMGVAMLWLGRRDAALAVGRWMRALLEAQPDPRTKLHFVWDHSRGLVTNYPAAQGRDYVVDATLPAQRYYQFGIAAALLASLGGVTGDPAWLDLGRRYLHLSRHYHQDVYRQPQSGKIGWGAAWAHRISGRDEDRALATTVASYLLERQSPQGWWGARNPYGTDGAAAETPSTDITAEFVAHLSWIACVAP